ncbi:Serine/threonine-protein kinase rio2 [Zancudomyces culisetae]|uniref:non-specific serine/threonine protein kinase n=1 Tax=Zancudomyces culisetae TaxID=1213189 RepID=A0A1R1PX85_ZANCU|nr:Serine/threonine-protein kinase rio2 [Zancudomyces culisetae]|eukprot:OMH85606.1 Serine/threonine-protein kinase rio2 [Zancudomyces culisetae]
MELLDNAIPLKQINKIENPGRLYSDLMDLIVKLANYGLIHCDFNEFNLLIDNNTLKPILIDFPQMVSVTHKNAEFYFNRDVECIRTFFRKKFNYVSLVYPMFTKDVTSVDVGAKNGGDGESTSAGYRLDLIVANSSFTHKMEKELEQVNFFYK